MLPSHVWPSEYSQILHISPISHHIHHVYRTFATIVELHDTLKFTTTKFNHIYSLNILNIVVGGGDESYTIQVTENIIVGVDTRLDLSSGYFPHRVMQNEMMFLLPEVKKKW